MLWEYYILESKVTEMEEELNEAGDKRWEVVDSWPSTAEWKRTFLLKRPVDPNE